MIKPGNVWTRAGTSLLLPHTFDIMCAQALSYPHFCILLVYHCALFLWNVGIPHGQQPCPTPLIELYGNRASL